MSNHAGHQTAKTESVKIGLDREIRELLTIHGMHYSKENIKTLRAKKIVWLGTITTWKN